MSRLRLPPKYPHTTPENLNRLLSRLQHTLLSPDTSPYLRKSSYERAKVGANLEHARTLLLNLEHSLEDSASILPSKPKESALQPDLQQKRELLEQMKQRLQELNQLDVSSSEGSGDSDEEDEDRFRSYAPSVKEEGGLESGGSGSGGGNETLQNTTRNLTSELRARHGGADKDGGTTATGTSLFPSMPITTTSDPSLAQTETLLSHNRTEQEAITTSLIDMAKQLKQQSLHFGSTLESEKGILNRAVEGLDKNAQNMEIAGQRMGTLRRMTEGKGWWDRMKLYALIFGLWVVAYLIVFVGPKIRSNAALNHSSSNTEAEYDRLRDLARQEAAKRSSCFDHAHEAYESGDGRRAHELSEEGKAHAKKMDEYNRQARDFILRENNAEGRVASDTIDLHGLFVEEAEEILEMRINEARRQGQTHLHVIVGKGNHSRNHVQKIKPSVEQVCRELGLQYATEENEGRMFINLQGGPAHMPPPPHAPQYGGGGGYPEQHHGGQLYHDGQHHGGQQQHGQQQNQNDEVEEIVKKGLPKLFKALKGCCMVM
ncbi:DUF1771-domain-containing protein [Zopfia rhizophila CBS 207.26]|uniref:DUF1771-domain-containing protein n=1 Tax=Zopfia rhizophila CBS 207.26 TaxID=1314779 RepID=A0A6A6DT44_9PEZI|nr:DUF1771-domain-containing protein [Zopfia rhizophila CBS 207.26]